MRRSLGMLFIAAVVLQEQLAGQNDVPSVAAELASAHTTVAGDLQAAADKMPGEKYSYRPASGVRSFGQIVAHVAGGQFLYCAQAGQRLDPETLKKLNEMRPYSEVETAAGAKPYEKEELVALLAASSAFCRNAYSAAPRDTKALRALIANVAHDNEHYGNIVTYLRLNGLVPPSTERAKTPAAR